MIRRALFASLALAPITIALHYVAHPSETVEFVLAAISLIPLAWLIGEATEHAAEHTEPGIGGFLNATFGNAPELIIALIAVNDALTDVVRGSLTGSVVSNVLLVLGASLVAGGRGEVDRFSSFLSFGLIGFATALFLIPSVPSWGGDPDTHGLVVPLLVVQWLQLQDVKMADKESRKPLVMHQSLQCLGLARSRYTFDEYASHAFECSLKKDKLGPRVRPTRIRLQPAICFSPDSKAVWRENIAAG